ncbi:MAG TPA: hypothetical protein VHD90_01835 [Phototrophicaceae bacterium]|nr:hypothetical protein [Phototrophicaceae bacterium]
MKKAAQSSPPQPFSLRVVNRVLRLPRLSRIILAVLFALAVTLAVTPIIDGIYLNSFFDESTRVAPSLVSTALGIVFYFIGWRLIVGYAGEEPSARPAVFFYVIGGILLVILVVVLVVFGAITGSIQ